MATFHRINGELGNKILEKYRHACQICGSQHDVLVHHIKRVAITDPLYTDESNLTVYCRSCHMAHHRNNGEIPRPISPLGKGITFNPRGRKFKLHLDQKHLGYFNTIEEARQAKDKYLAKKSAE